MSSIPPTSDTGPVTTDASILTLPLMAERIAHEREMRQTHDQYERELRLIGQDREKETRELVQKLSDVALTLRSDVIEQRLDVLNGERTRQENDRSSFATRSEARLQFEAFDQRIKKMELADSEQLGRGAGRQGVQTFLAPNLQSVLQMISIVVLLYLAVRAAPL